MIKKNLLPEEKEHDRELNDKFFIDNLDEKTKNTPEVKLLKETRDHLLKVKEIHEVNNQMQNLILTPEEIAKTRDILTDFYLNQNQLTNFNKIVKETNSLSDKNESVVNVHRKSNKALKPITTTTKQQQQKHLPLIDVNNFKTNDEKSNKNSNDDAAIIPIDTLHFQSLVKKKQMVS